MAHFLPHYQNLEILSSVNIRDETWALFHDLLIKLAQFFELAVPFLIGVEYRSDLYGFRWAGVSQFDVKRPLSKIFLNDRALISEISLFIFTNMVFVEYAGMHRARRFIIIQNAVHNWHDFKDLVFVWRDLNLEIDVLT